MATPLITLLATVVIAALAGLGTAAPQTGLQRTTVLGGKVSVLIPAGFKTMSAELLVVKYPNVNRPSLVYTNERGTINVAFDHTVHRLPANQLPAALESMRTTFKNLYPSATWFRSEIRPINGRQFFLIDLRTPAADIEVRNIMAGTSLDDRLLMITFNVIKTFEKEWVPIGNRIIESISVEPAAAVRP